MYGKTIALNMPFSKGLVAGYTDNLVPEQYAVKLKNIRIINGGITNRKGYLKKNILGYRQSKAMVIVEDILYVLAEKISDGKLWLIKIVDIETAPGVTSLVEIGLVGLYSGSIKMVNYGEHIIITTGIGYPYVYNITTGIGIQLDNTYVADLFYPDNILVYGNRTIITGKNKLYGCIPLVPLASKTTIETTTTTVGSTTTEEITEVQAPNPETPNPAYFYTWVGTGIDEIEFKTNIIGLIAGLNNFYVFTENGFIYEVGYDQTSSLLVSREIGDGGRMFSKDSLCISGNVIYYMTTDYEVKTLGYREGTDSKEIATLSGIENVGIKAFTDKIKTEGPVTITGYYDSDSKLVNFFIPYNEIYSEDDGTGISLIYDLVNRTFLLDTNKGYGYGIEGGYFHNGFGYSDNTTELNIYINERGGKDNGGIINWEYKKVFNFNPTEKKEFRGFNYSGTTRQDTIFEVIIDIDTRNIGTFKYNRTTSYLPLNALTEFTQNITSAILKKKGKKLYLTFKNANTIESDKEIKFLIDYLDIVLNQNFKSYGKADKYNA